MSLVCFGAIGITVAAIVANAISKNFLIGYFSLALVMLTTLCFSAYVLTEVFGVIGFLVCIALWSIHFFFIFKKHARFVVVDKKGHKDGKSGN